MIISLIAAMTRDRVIGRENQMPWHLPADLKHFKQVTMGKPVIMGRKTYESIGRPLPGRQNIVITRDPDYAADGVTVVAGVKQALVAAGAVEEVMVIGGAQIYQQLLDRADRLYLTMIDTDASGDAYFPEVDLAQWQQAAVASYAADEKNAFDLQFIDYVRK